MGRIPLPSLTAERVSNDEPPSRGERLPVRYDNHILLLEICAQGKRNKIRWITGGGQAGMQKRGPRETCSF